MSHFTVMVVGENIDEQLAPFDENIKMEPYVDNILEEDQKKDFIGFCKKEKGETSENFEELYEKYGKDWNRNSWRKNADGEWAEYSTYNPKSKWDWYSVGGRWKGFFRVKPDAPKDQIDVVAPEIFENEENNDYIKSSDCLKKKYIDEEAMRNDAEQRARMKYEKIEKVFPNGIPKILTWEKLLKTIPENSNDEKMKELGYIYHEQEGRKKLKEYGYLNQNNLSEEDFNFYIFSNLDDYQISKEEYIQNARNNALIPFAIVKNGIWHESGSMGWWAIVSDKKSDWEKIFNDIFNSIDDEELITLVDCHI